MSQDQNLKINQRQHITSLYKKLQEKGKKRAKSRAILSAKSMLAKNNIQVILHSIHISKINMEMRYYCILSQNYYSLVSRQIRSTQTCGYKRKTQKRRSMYFYPSSHFQIHADQIQNLEPAPLSLQIQIESTQCIDDLLLDLCEKQLQNQVLLSESAINSKQEVCKSFRDICSFIQQNSEDEYKDENYEDLIQKFEYVMDQQSKKDLQIENDLIFVTIDEAICLFLKDLSLNMKISFLMSIELVMLVLRKCLNDEYKVDNQILYTKEQAPLQVGKYLNKFILEIIPQELGQNKLKEFYDQFKDKQMILLNNEKGNWVIQTVLLHFGNWLFYERFSQTYLQFEEE